MKTHRTWVIAPDAQSLARRWAVLQGETNPERRVQLYHPDRDRGLDKIVKVNLGSYTTRPVPVGADNGAVVDPIRYAFRSFDRQWIIPDHRLLSQARSRLWDGYSQRQVYLTGLDAHSPSSGPAVTFAADIPDNDHYRGSFGGRAYPLWADRAATQPNVPVELLAHLAKTYGRDVGAADVMAYIGAVMAHPAFTGKFEKNLVRPGLRLPLTAIAALFEEAVALGSEVIWLHCYGERFTDAALADRKDRRDYRKMTLHSSPPTAPFRPRRGRSPKRWTTMRPQDG